MTARPWGSDLNRWLRLRPSGYVHFVVSLDSHGLRRTACGRLLPWQRLTEDFPPATWRCHDCSDAVDQAAVQPASPTQEG